MWCASTMLTRKPEAQMDFDFDKVVSGPRRTIRCSMWQYAHARIRSTLRKGAAEGFAPRGDALDLLGEEELALVKLAAQFPRLVEAAAQARTAPAWPFSCTIWPPPSTPTGTWQRSARQALHRVRKRRH
jgi:hypothetical protein